MSYEFTFPSAPENADACDFYSVAGKTALLDRYLDSLFLEAEKYTGAELKRSLSKVKHPRVLASGLLKL